jgi:hypothetical protein
MNTRIRVALIATMLVALHLSTAGNKSGCSKEEASTIQSPVQAVATVYRHADGRVDADLTLISTAVNPAAFVDTARATRLRVIDDDGALAEVPLRAAGSGHYSADSVDNPDLVFDYGVLFAFDFELDDEAAAKKVAGGSFTAQVNAPDAGVNISVPEPPQATELTAVLKIDGTYERGILRVIGPSGDVTYSNWDMSTPDFDGSKWASLITGKTHTIPSKAFPDSGAYTVAFGACTFVQGFDPNLSSELGFFSGFLACDGVETTVDVP